MLTHYVTVTGCQKCRKLPRCMWIYLTIHEDFPMRVSKRSWTTSIFSWKYWKYDLQTFEGGEYPFGSVEILLMHELRHFINFYYHGKMTTGLHTVNVFFKFTNSKKCITLNKYNKEKGEIVLKINMVYKVAVQYKGQTIRQREKWWQKAIKILRQSKVCPLDVSTLCFCKNEYDIFPTTPVALMKSWLFSI